MSATTSKTKSPSTPTVTSVPDSAAHGWRVALDALASRVSALVEADRSPDDVADHRRGRTFPTAMILRDLERGPREAAEKVIPWAALPTTLTDLAEFLPLDDIDIALLLVAVAPALDPRFEHFYIVLNNDVDARGPSVATAFRLAGLSPLDPEARRRLRKDGPLRTLGLIDVGPAKRALPSQVITIPERVVAHLLGDDYPDPNLTTAVVVDDHEALDATLLPTIDVSKTVPIVLRARAGSAGLDQARRLALTDTGVEPVIVNLARTPFDERVDTSSDAYQEFVRSCMREGALSGRFVVIDARTSGPDAPVQHLLAQFDAVGAPVIILVDARRSLGAWERRTVSLPLPTLSQRRAWWKLLAPEADDALASTATHLDPQDIRDAANGTESAALHRVTGQTRRSRVQTVKPALRLSDVILNPRSAAMLQSLCDRVRYRSTVLDEWGMRPGGARGRGVTALFAGPAGTGKTMSGEAIAGELGVPLFVVDLASVVDKYIGETEKNLEDVFRTVENEDGVLLFDEADALFGKRSDVSDARDRYANIEVAYLLQRIEAFDGLAILTTNLRANLDDAFQRRLDMIIDFPEPDEQARGTIWRAALGPFADTLSDEQRDALATLDLTGGYIRSAVVSAAYLAASQKQTLQAHHVLAGAREEWRKAGRINFPEHAFERWS